MRTHQQILDTHKWQKDNEGVNKCLSELHDLYVQCSEIVLDNNINPEDKIRKLVVLDQKEGYIMGAILRSERDG